MRVLGFLVGLILLLPGACSLTFMAAFAVQGLDAYTRDLFGMLVTLWLVCLAISVGGVVLIRRSLRGLKPSPLDPPA